MWGAFIKSPLGLGLRVRAPYRIQNPSERQNTPQNTPRILSRNQKRKKYEKYTKIGVLVIFSYFFVLGEDSGCILECILDFRGVLYFVGGAGTRKAWQHQSSNFEISISIGNDCHMDMGLADKAWRSRSELV